VRSQGVLGEYFARALIDQLALHPCVGILLEAFVFARIDALVGEVARLKLPHFLFDLLEVFRREGRGAVEVVVESVVDGRPDAQLGFGIEFEHCRGQKMSGRMAVHTERLGILGSEDLQAGVLFERAGEVV
jgi:hypothetical protein